MPRKSARLLSKSKLPQQDTESDEFMHKRQRMADVEERNIIHTDRRQQFRIQNNRLPISHTHAITTSMIVPSDEVDSLACREMFQAGGGCWVDEEDVVHVVTNPPRQRQLFRFSNHFQSEMKQLQRLNPLPNMEWADSHEVWQAMKMKEEKYKHSRSIFVQHPDVRPNMRAVLLTWLTEVCEVYKLHKETYYLAMDFIDRFLLATENMKTSQLQLMGVTALFVAAKIEEIYPPKSTEFAYVADGAFEVEDIHRYELMMIKALNWLLAPMTPNAWIQLYLQVAACRHRARSNAHASPSTRKAHVSPSTSNAHTSPSIPDTPGSHSPCDLNSSSNSGVSELVACAEVIDLTEADCSSDSSDNRQNDCEGCKRNNRRSFILDSLGVHDDDDTDSADEVEVEMRVPDDENIIYPLYSPNEYTQVARLLDLVMLDSYCLKFRYSVLAAAVIYHATDIKDVCQLTSLTWEELQPCVEWMNIHKGIIDQHQPMGAQIRSFENINECDAHKIQYHSISKEMWEEALQCSEAHFLPKTSLEILAEVIQREHERCSSPGPSASSFITPPRSNKKTRPLAIDWPYAFT